MTHTATEHTLIGNDNSPERVIADALADQLHGDCEIGTCDCPPMRDLAKEVLEQLREHFWVVPKVEHDANPHVRPYIRGGLIYRYASDRETPEQTRLYAAQLLAAADKAEEVTR
jgi:hypothetical protein